MREIAFGFLVSGTNMERSWEEWRDGAGVILCGGGMCRRRREGARALTKNGLQSIKKAVGTGKNTYFWEDVWKEGEECSKKYSRLFSISLGKESKVADLYVQVEGRKGMEA